MENKEFSAVKIASYAAITALGESVQSSLENILAGQSGLNYEPPSPYPVAHSALVTKAETRAYEMALKVAESALLPLNASERAQTALVLSTAKGEALLLEKAIKEDAPNEAIFPANLTAKLQETLSLHRVSYTISNACASGLIAIAQAMRLVQDGDFNHVLVLGVDLASDFVISGFGALHALSTAFTRPYAVERDGLNLGEGAAALLLTRSNLPAKGFLRGFGVSNDANHITGPSRTGDGLAMAMDKALKSAGLSPEHIDLINGHGTGTRYNDAMELLAINTIFPEKCPPLISFKGYIGHTIGAAGVIEAALLLEAMARQTIPASLGFNGGELPPQVTIPQKPLYNAKLNNVLAMKAGFGGINAALVISQAAEEL